jgi:hypothetical protein
VPAVKMFHVEHHLLAYAEGPEQGVKHVFNAGATGNAVERTSRLAQGFGNDQQVGSGPGLPQMDQAFFQNFPMASVYRNLALARQQGLATGDEKGNELVDALPRDTGDIEIGFGIGRVASQIRFSRQHDGAVTVRDSRPENRATG